MNRHTIITTVCTELMLSVHRADCKRAIQPYSSGGGGAIFPGSIPVHGYNTFMLVIECFLTRPMLFLKVIYILCIVIFHMAVLTSTNDLCFRTKIRKNVYPCKPQFYYIKVWCKRVYITRACFMMIGFFERAFASNKQLYFYR